MLSITATIAILILLIAYFAKLLLLEERLEHLELKSNLSEFFRICEIETANFDKNKEV